MTVGEITAAHVAEYLRLEDGEYTVAQLEAILAAAKQYICAYTGRSEQWIASREDLYAVVMVLAQDMYDNRSLYVTGTQEKNVNRMIWSALGMHSVNLL